MPNNVAYISFLATVNQGTAEQLIGFIGGKIIEGVTEFHLLLSSPGGNVRDGIAMYNLLRGLPIGLTTYNVGQVNSIANIIYLAGTNRLATPTSSFMFHGVGFDIAQQARFEEKDLTEKLDSLQNDQKLIADIIVDRSDIDAEKAHDLFLRAAFMKPDEALEAGIVHRIEELAIPEGTPFFQLVFQR